MFQCAVHMSKTAVVIDIISQVRRGFGGSFRRAVLNYKEVQKRKSLIFVRVDDTKEWRVFLVIFSGK